MISAKVKNIYLVNKKIFESISYLTIIQMVAMILSFLTYPYLIKTLGLGLYGKIMLSQAVVSYVAIFVNFGFNISAAKSASEKINQPEQLNEICSAIITVKTLIWLFVTFIYVICILHFVPDNKNKVLYLSAYTLTFNEFLVCQWFYQAIEELKIIATLSIISKVANVILIFLLVKSPSNYYFVSLITGGAYFFTGVYSILHMFRYHVKFVVPSIRVIINVTKDSFNLFLTSAIIAIKNKLDVILIGAFISSEMVAIYDFAQKILNILLLPITIINNAIFPRMNREKNKLFLKKIILISFGLTFVYITFSELLLPYIMHYIFVVSHDSINITRLMILSAIFFSLSLPLAQNGLIVFNYTKLHLLGMLSTTALYIGIMALGYKCSFLTDVYYFVYTSLILFAYETFYRYSFCKWKRIL
ncbi:hypothetical protein I5P57_01687 [Escherichia coli]|uniref:O54 family O-antigen flippase n=1 Tax=Escherichia coli TaxID=562 RepID=UPI0035D0E6A8